MSTARAEQRARMAAERQRVAGLTPQQKDAELGMKHRELGIKHILAQVALHKAKNPGSGE